MFQRKRKYLLSFVVIGSIMMLSFRDTLSVLHTLLHQVPNPIHYHGAEDLVYHHQSNNQHKSFFAHESNHTHSLEDHVHGPKKEKHVKSDQKEKSEKSEVEKSIKTILFLNSLQGFRFHSSLSKGQSSHNLSYFSHLPSLPLGPPPEIGA